MKFMQRAAASGPASPGSPAQPGTPDSANKRQKLDSPPNVNDLANHKAIQDAIEAEDRRIQAAVDKAAADAGDTRWTLNFTQAAKPQPAGTMRVQQMSFANIDRAPAVIRAMEDDEGDKALAGGRRSFGKFNRKLEKQIDPEAESSSSEDDSEEEDDGKGDYEHDSDISDGEDAMDQLIRTERDAAARKAKEERREKRRKEKKELERLAKNRKGKEVNLNSLSSISGGGQAGGKPGTSKGPCYGCGKEGHMASDCPQKGKRKSFGGGNDRYAGERDQNRNKKARKSY